MAMKSFWIESADLPEFPKLTSDMQVDVVVVGAGITGITAAYLLKKAGRSVALLDRDRCARVDTGHTTAHLTYVTDTRLTDLVKTVGRDHAQAAWDAGLAAIEQIRSLIDEQKIDCEYATIPGYLHAPWKEPEKDESQEFKDEAALARELGFNAQYAPAVPFAKRPGICFANQAKFHPRRYLAGLLQAFSEAGGHVFENTQVDEFQDEPMAAKANGYTIRCAYLVIATHVPLVGKSGIVSATLLQTKLASYSSYAVGAKVPKESVPHALFWDTADPYYYLRVDRHAQFDYVIFGGEDHKTGQETNAEDRVGRLEELLKAIVPQAEVDARWTGQVIETPDSLPYIGETAERQFVATGYAGNGMTFGTLAGMMAADAATGRKNPWGELFAVNRKTLRGTWDYIKENIDYPYYFLKDRMIHTDGTSLASLKRGEGQIVLLDGQRVAAYRGEDNSVTRCSPICTHMGCVVHWNVADATWDCPCHGSRFLPNGEVLSGPAETRLELIATKDERQQKSAAE